MHLGVVAALENERIGLRDEIVVRAVDDEHRRIIRSVQQRTPRELLHCRHEVRGGRLFVEAHVVADDTRHTEGQIIRVFFSPSLSTGPPSTIAASRAPESPVIAEKLPPNENPRCATFPLPIFRASFTISSTISSPLTDSGTVLSPVPEMSKPKIVMPRRWANVT